MAVKFLGQKTNTASFELNRAGQAKGLKLQTLNRTGQAEVTAAGLNRAGQAKGLKLQTLNRTGHAEVTAAGLNRAGQAKGGSTAGRHEAIHGASARAFPGAGGPPYAPPFAFP